MNEKYMTQANENLEWKHASLYLPPYYCPKDIESVYNVRCMIRQRENENCFDENIQGFTAILTINT